MDRRLRGHLCSGYCEWPGHHWLLYCRQLESGYGAGIVRAFDARTGQLRWTWNPTPWAEKTRLVPVPPTRGRPSLLIQEDLVFIPTGSAAPDYYGGIRKGDDKWANSVVALRASTGKFVWGFQVVHHDLWDYDVPRSLPCSPGKTARRRL